MFVRDSRRRVIPRLVCSPRPRLAATPDTSTDGLAGGIDALTARSAFEASLMGVARPLEAPPAGGAARDEAPSRRGRKAKKAKAPAGFGAAPAKPSKAKATVPTRSESNNCQATAIPWTTWTWQMVSLASKEDSST